MTYQEIKIKNMEKKHNSFKLPTMTGNAFSKGNTNGTKEVHQYSEMIASGNYPQNINSFQKNEINELWKQGKSMQAVQKLQELLTPQKAGKTTL